MPLPSSIWKALATKELAAYWRLPPLPCEISEAAQAFIAKECSSHREEGAPVLQVSSRFEVKDPAGHVCYNHQGDHCFLGFWKNKYPREWFYKVNTHRLCVPPEQLVRLRDGMIDLVFLEIPRSEGGTLTRPLLRLEKRS